MTSAAAVNEHELAQLRDRCSELEESNRQLERINVALMNRVERDMDLQGNSFSLFQAAIALEEKVKERTGALTRALHTLEETNRELQASNDAAQTASRAKSSFLAAMSHELRTPMNGVIGMTDLLLMTPLNAAQRQSANTIQQSALMLLKILNDILDFSKIEAGRMVTEATPFDLRARTDDALQMFGPQLRTKGLALHVDWPANIPNTVIGDPTRYAQIVTNLVANAVKFTATGAIFFRARLLADPDLALILRFEVEDTGVGIKEEALPALFQSFSQADSSTTREYGGTGLGLAIVRRLCHLMGGECGVTSTKGKGSCFWFTLTLQRATLEGVAPRAETAQTLLAARVVRPNKLGLKVLVVEDNAVNQLVARGHLEALGCECEVAGDGAQAVRLLQAGHDFDLVLMDCQMPVMDGLEASQRVRAAEAGGSTHVPIVALTASAMVGDRELCLAAGMDDFLSKPFQLHELAAVLARSTHGRSSVAGHPPVPGRAAGH